MWLLVVFINIATTNPNPYFTFFFPMHFPVAWQRRSAASYSCYRQVQRFKIGQENFQNEKLQSAGQQSSLSLYLFDKKGVLTCTMVNSNTGVIQPYNFQADTHSKKKEEELIVQVDASSSTTDVLHSYTVPLGSPPQTAWHHQIIGHSNGEIKQGIKTTRFLTSVNPILSNQSGMQSGLILWDLSETARSTPSSLLRAVG